MNQNLRRALICYLMAGAALCMVTGRVTYAQLTTLGAGKGGASGAASPSTCSDGSTLDIDWTAADGLGSFGVACVNGATGIAASTLGTFNGSATPGSGGLVLVGGNFQFTNVTWLAQGSGTLYEELTLSSTTSTRRYFSVSDGTTVNEASMRTLVTTIRALETVANTPIALVDSGLAVATATLYKIAFSYTTGSQILCVNGANNATASGVGAITGLNTAYVGASGSGTNAMSGTITRTKFFPPALADAAACDTLTTP